MAKKSMKAAPKKPRGRPKGRQPEERRPNAERLRQLIQAGMLVSRVQRIALAQVKGAPDKLNVQVRAGTALLNKVLPDLQRSEVTGDDGGPIEIITRAE